MPTFRFALTACLLTVALAGAAQPALAQAPTQAASAAPMQAQDLRREFQQLMRRYPPALGRIFKLDPALMTNTNYMAPYPALAAFIQQHPEIARSSAYFLSFVDDSEDQTRDPNLQMRSEALRTYRDMFTQLMAFSGFLTAGLALLWLVRYVVNHRRWLRTFKVQSDLHTKLLERFHSSEDVLAYLRSGGAVGLPQLSPVAVESTAPGMAAPFNRILWSIQAGVVLMCGGAGLLIIKQYVIEEAGDMLLTFGVLAASLGAGFVLAAGASYILSRSLGLFESARDHRAPSA